MDWNQIEGNWDLFKARVRTKWRRLSEEDLERIAGQRDQLERKIHERYGFSVEHISKEVEDWSRWQSLETAPERTPIAPVRR